MTFNPIVREEHAHTINGVSGRMMAVTMRSDERPGLFCQQRWISEERSLDGGKAKDSNDAIRVKIRFDDELRNGHNSFAITCDILSPVRRGRVDIGGGANHDAITKAFPELAHLIKWHLCDSAGPMHYMTNTVFLAGDCDSYGKRAGDASRVVPGVQFGRNPIKHVLKRGFVQFLAEVGVSCNFDFEVLPLDHDRGCEDRVTFAPKWTFGGFGSTWHEGPFDTEQEALDFLHALQHCYPQFVDVVQSYSHGKARELDAARRAAVWPEATDEELSVDPDELRAALTKRLPGLIADMRADLEAAGFMWERKG